LDSHSTWLRLCGAGQVNSPPPFRTTLEVSASVRRTTLRSQGSTLLGGDARLELSEALSVGGAGWISSAAIPITGTNVGSDLALHVAHGGLLLEWRLVESESGMVATRLMLGAGNAKVRLPVIGTEIATDNFGVLEPEITGERPLWSFLALRAQVAYRWVFDVEDLPQQF
jgi:hypothetical protein